MGLFDSIGSLISEAPSIALSAIPGVGQFLGAQQQNAANAQQASNQMNFQSSMSDTAHTREVADLKNAGLNPMLSAMGGSGASTPSGTSAQMQNTLSGMGQLGPSAMQMMQSKQDMDLTEQQIQKATFDAKTAESNAQIAEDNARDVDFTQRAKEGDPAFVGGNNNGFTNVPSYYKNLQTATDATNTANTSTAKTQLLQNAADQLDSKFHTQHNTLDNVLDRVGKGIGIGAQGASMISPGIKLQTHFQNSAGSIRINPKTGEILP